jgi:2-dehydropantoate 2-reductase
MKGASSLETDYFNGEIIMLGRLHGAPTPTNEFLQHCAARMLRGEVQVGSLTTDQLDADWQTWLGEVCAPVSLTNRQ